MFSASAIAFSAPKFVVHLLKFVFTFRFRNNTCTSLTNQCVVLLRKVRMVMAVVDVAVEPDEPDGPP